MSEYSGLFFLDMNSQILYKYKADFQSGQVTPAGSFKNSVKRPYCENIKNIHKKTCVKKLSMVFLMSVKETADHKDRRYP